MRKQRAKKVDLSRKPAAPLTTVSLRPERISLLRDLLSETHGGNVRKGELSDYVAIGKVEGCSEELLTFRSPEQLAYSEARVMSIKNKTRWKSSSTKLRLTNDVPLYLNKETQTVREIDPESASSAKNTKKHSQLYFFRHVTAQRYEDVEKCSYLGRREAGKGGDGRVTAGGTSKSGSPAVNSQKMFIFRPPALKVSKPGAMRRQLIRNLHSALNS